jgi:hypothetical protein
MLSAMDVLAFMTEVYKMITRAKGMGRIDN